MMSVRCNYFEMSVSLCGSNIETYQVLGNFQENCVYSDRHNGGSGLFDTGTWNSGKEQSMSIFR